MIHLPVAPPYGFEGGLVGFVSKPTAVRLRLFCPAVVLLALAGPLLAAPAADAPLARVAASLPAGWRADVVGDSLTIARAGDCWVLLTNRINAPESHETDAQRESRIRRLGRRTTARLSFRLEPLWSARKWREARAVNGEVRQALAVLPQKHGIDDLLDRGLARKGGPRYTAHSDADHARLDAYEAEKAQLERRLVELPRYESARWSLFLISVVGQEDDLHEVAPLPVSREVHQVEEVLGRCLSGGR